MKLSRFDELAVNRFVQQPNPSFNTNILLVYCYTQTGFPLQDLHEYANAETGPL